MEVLAGRFKGSRASFPPKYQPNTPGVAGIPDLCNGEAAEGRMAGGNCAILQGGITALEGWPAWRAMLPQVAAQCLAHGSRAPSDQVLV
jgi:hypothetical protein